MTTLRNPNGTIKRKPGPNPEQLARVLAFAKLIGRDWKAQLACAWYCGTDATMKDGHLLRQVRNQFGPKWLRYFKLPKDAA